MVIRPRSWVAVPFELLLITRLQQFTPGVNIKIFVVLNMIVLRSCNVGGSVRIEDESHLS
jgi:hypothetical protein